MNIYSVSCIATRPKRDGTVDASSTSGYLYARNDNEAYGIAIRMAHDAFPVRDGWGNQNAAVGIIPWPWIDNVQR